LSAETAETFLFGVLIGMLLGFALDDLKMKIKGNL